MMNVYLIFDGSNIAHRTFFAHQQIGGNDIGGLALHYALTTFNKYHKQYSPTATFVAFDRSNWRKMYTQSEHSKSRAVYKANRRQNMTPQQLQQYAEFQEHLKDLEELFRDHTSVYTLSRDLLEADDLIAGFCQKYPEDKIIIVSADGDYKQLLRNTNVVLINPMDDKQMLCEDVDWFMFEKCMRGDVGDNVKSALPRVRKTRLEKAFTDPLEYTSLMAEKWTDGEVEYTVGELFEENKLLMDLTNQPDAIKQMIMDTIDQSIANPGKYNNFQFLKFCGRNGLQRIIDNIQRYMGLLAS